MGFFSFLDPALNFVFSPLMQLPPFWSILVLSFILSLVIIIIYKYTTNQDLMRDIKAELKEFQKQAKELRSEPAKAMEVQKKAMETNMKYMMHSFKPMIFTFIPVILIFGWLNSHLAFQPIMPNTEFTVSAIAGKDSFGFVELVDLPSAITMVSNASQPFVNGQAVWTLRGASGDYFLNFRYNNQSLCRKELLITGERAYKPVEERCTGALKSVKINNAPVKVINLFGWKIGWFGAYIIWSLVFSGLLRKLLKVY